MNISLEEYTEEEKRFTGNMIKGGKIHDKLCDYLDSIGYKEPIINDLSVAVWKAVEIIVALKEREAKLVEALRLLEQVSTAPKNGKISLELYREKAREVLKDLEIEL